MGMVRGKIGKESIKYTEKLVMFRFYKEQKNLRKMILLEKKIKPIIEKLHRDERKGDVKKFVEDQKVTLNEIIILMSVFSDEINHLVFDMHNIKNTIKEIYKIDLDVEHKKFPKEQIIELKKELQKDFLKVNNVLRKTGDLFRASGGV